MSYESFRHVAVTVADGLAEVSLNRSGAAQRSECELHQELEDLWPVLAG